MTFQQPNNIADLIITLTIASGGIFAMFKGHIIFGLIVIGICSFSFASILTEIKEDS